MTARPQTIAADQRDPCTVVLTSGAHKLTYVFKDAQVEGFASAWERAASFAYTLAGEPLGLASLTMLRDSKRITQATLTAGDELAFCVAALGVAS